VIALALAAAAVVLPATAAGAGVVRSAAHADVILSNETTSTTYSTANDNEPIRTAPSLRAPKIISLTYSTPDGFVQSYELLREHYAQRHWWVQLRVPMRPNGQIGWVPRSALTGFIVVHTEIVVNRAAETLTLYNNGKTIYSAPVGVGKPSTPTPAGHFWVTESFPSSDPFYGPWAFGTSDYSVLTEWPGGGIVGIHGTNEPGLIPGDPSHGCMRLRNSDVLKLSHLVPVGTPVLIV
jgi:lipoprotein-anchoring transpeptidase ErfK/SrfK